MTIGEKEKIITETTSFLTQPSAKIGEIYNNHWQEKEDNSKNHKLSHTTIGEQKMTTKATSGVAHLWARKIG